MVNINKNENLISLSYGNFEVTINLNEIVNIDGYIPVLYAEEIDNNEILVVTGVLDGEYNIVVPFRKNVVSSEDFDKYNFDNDVSVYENKKAIYKVNENRFYVINLENVEFTKVDGAIIPQNPIVKMMAYYGIDDENIIVYMKDYAYMYNIVQNKVISDIYNMITPNEEHDELFSAYYIKEQNKYVDPLIIEMLITNDGGIATEARLNKQVLAILPDRILGNKEEIIKYCDDCFNTYIEDGMKEDYPKVLQ